MPRAAAGAQGKYPCAVSVEARDTLQPGELGARPGRHCHYLLSGAPALLPPGLGLPSRCQPGGGISQALQVPEKQSRWFGQEG
ncbi:kinesin family member C2 [Rhinolophus ferrumequinum]|uniref:Kinesin family member C2 n=1 Tax=Rhinolophus ferrumequinum TaxID=59479 RepID=A0A7J7R0J2_RHIFE|nr:kinesin family member C2 [Rhinolophus ferrumequinum]